jgi:hypothetical protein
MPLVRLAKGQEVSLGCGTLILIAIIVAMCSGGMTTGVARLESQVNEMNRRLERIENRLDELGNNLPPEKR